MVLSHLHLRAPALSSHLCNLQGAVPLSKVCQAIALACGHKHYALDTFNKESIRPLLSAAAQKGVPPRQVTNKDIATLAALSKEPKRDSLLVRFVAAFGRTLHTGSDTSQT